MYIDDIYTCTEKGKELETVIQIIKTYSQDIGMEFGIEKCAIFIIKSRKIETTKGIELPNQIGENILRILEAETIKQIDMKEKVENITSENQENISKLSSAAEILSKV